MPIARLGLYSHFEFVDNEEQIAMAFSMLNKAYLQNRRYEIVLQRDALIPNFEHLDDYLFAKAQLDGRIDQLTELIETEPQGSDNVVRQPGE